VCFEVGLAPDHDEFAQVLRTTRLAELVARLIRDVVATTVTLLLVMHPRGSEDGRE
jgi:hypothetical protein